MILHLNVLNPSMKDTVASHVDTAHVVTVEDGIFNGDVLILENPLKPYDIACCHDSTFIFCLYAR